MTSTPRHPGTNARIGMTEFVSMTQAELDKRVQDECDGGQCPLWFPGCRPGECPKDRKKT